MKLVTWNTQWCCGLDGVVSPARIVEGARSLAGEGGFDVLCLQEIAQGYPDMPGAPGDQPANWRPCCPATSCSSAPRWTSSTRAGGGTRRLRRST